MKVIVVMGVAGSGKTTIGRLLSTRLKIDFYDADDFHPESNVKKMTNGISLDDQDRKPWLETLSHKISEWQNDGGAVLACSALKDKYRELLTNNSLESVSWVYLDADITLIKSRIAQRKDHFFNPSIIESQFATLEPPDYGLIVSVDQSPDLIVEKILSYLDNHDQ